MEMRQRRDFGYAETLSVLSQVYGILLWHGCMIVGN